MKRGDIKAVYDFLKIPGNGKRIYWSINGNNNAYNFHNVSLYPIHVLAFNCCAALFLKKGYYLIHVSFSDQLLIATIDHIVGSIIHYL